jgi:hypothetical protein
VNAMLVATFEKLGFKENELVRTNTSLSVFIGDVIEAKGVMSVKLTIGSKTMATSFLVVGVKGRCLELHLPPLALSYSKNRSGDLVSKPPPDFPFHRAHHCRQPSSGEPCSSNSSQSIPRGPSVPSDSNPTGLPLPTGQIWPGRHRRWHARGFPLLHQWAKRPGRPSPLSRDGLAASVDRA